jgi:hypothetical protein
MSCTLNAKWAKLVGLAGVEPATSPLSGVRSNQLSYRPKLVTRAIHQIMVELRRIELLTSCVQGRRSPS